MESQHDHSDAQMPDSLVNPVDESQPDHVMTSPPIDADSSSELPVMEDDNTVNEVSMERNDPSLNNDVGDDETPASIMSTPQPNMNTDNSNDLQVVGDSATNQELQMEDTAPLRKAYHDGTFLARVSTYSPEPPKHADDHDDNMDVDSSTTPKKESTGGHDAASQDEPENHQTPTLFLDVVQPSPAASRCSHTTTSSTIEASTLCNPSLGEGRASAPKRRWSSSVDELADQMDASIPSDPQREFVFANMVEKLQAAWRRVLERCGMRLGWREAFTTAFEPDVAAIREKAMRPWAPLAEIADATEEAMLEQWRHRCRRVIDRYQMDMRRDLVAEAREQARRVGDQVLAAAAAAAAAQIRGSSSSSGPRSPHTPKRLRIPSTPGSRSHLFDLPPPFPNLPSSASAAASASGSSSTRRFPRTLPGAKSEAKKKRPAPLDVDALRSRVAGLDLNRANNDNDNNGNDNGSGTGTGTDPRTPTSAKRFKTSGANVSVPRRPLALPKGLTTPARRRFGVRERERVPATPTRSSRRARTPAPRVLGGEEDMDGDMDVDVSTPVRRQVVGHIGPYPVVQPEAQEDREGFAAVAAAADGDDDGNDADVSAEGEEEEEEGEVGEEENEDEDMEDGDDDVFTSHK
ncbi:uncharacterized protein F4807DRAFT_343892 [Annulohypoxylon truncatum]|uniref:uncharacterized protein n=1 Tax=Annulohypoxylon truncatum TaxID=327061 RepID=UPI0020080376|nr:uncharacterized protein F4807DRAFT_343892 [Annulohypoxylon truncatum]KAI1212648.1 hypothetical protein F4807DRAFT_343892 [Annulohypoxylon truncatum]